MTTLCHMLRYSRSRYYYQRQPLNNTELEELLKQIAGEFPCYGYRRLTVEVGRRDETVNSKRVRRVMKKLGLQAKRKVKTRHTTNSNHPFPRYANLVQDMSVNRPEHVWVADITYIRLQRDFVYLAVIMDLFTRQIRGWYLGRSLEQDLTLTALRQALENFTPTIHHSDQGLQYAATEYVELLQSKGVRISMAEVGEPAQNGYAERLMRTIKEEEVYLSEYEDYHDAYTQIGKFLTDVYNHKRIHSSLGYLTPAEFERQWRDQQSVAEIVI